MSANQYALIARKQDANALGWEVCTLHKPEAPLTAILGGDIFKHDQNPSVAEKRETKFYRGSASSWTVEDQQRLMTPSTTTREFQFVSMNNDARHQPSPQQTPQAQVHAPPNLAALQTTPYQHMDLQALASAATYMPLPPTTYGESANQGSDAMIDPNLDAGTRDGVGQSTIQGTTEQASGESRDDDDIEKRVARALTSVSENETAQTVEMAHAAANEIEKE